MANATEMLYHVIPRYAGGRSHMGVDYPDKGWPGPPALEPAVVPDDAARDALVGELRRARQADL